MILLSCTNVGKLKNGSLVSHTDGRKTDLTESQLVLIERLIKKGTDRVFEKKWQVGNWIELENDTGASFTIYSYGDRYFCIDDGALCYKVKDSDLSEFKLLFSAIH